MQRFLARVISTFSRRSPPSADSGPKRIARRAVLVAPIADGDQDRVALVALHVLEVLDEEGLVRVVGEEGVGRGVGAAQRPRSRR